MSMFNAANNEQYRKSTQGQLWLSHARKKCACGATITERQQKQQGGCNACKNKADTSGKLASASEQSPIGVANV